MATSKPGVNSVPVFVTDIFKFCGQLCLGDVLGIMREILSHGHLSKRVLLAIRRRNVGILVLARLRRFLGIC